MTQQTPDFVLAAFNPPSVWSFYETFDQAEARRDEVNAAPSNFRQADYQPMTYEAYKARERAFWVDGTEKEITEDQFHEMLNVLPPMNWERHAGFESFLMCEFTSGVYTEQYARRGDKYFSKTVDAFDRTTWMR